jgi:phosphoribosyl 1,2-cyclic phosphodiesterase
LITLHTLASGSEGNCLLLSAGSTHLLLDAGISCRRINVSLGQLGLSLSDVSAVLITHDHSDHISGLDTMARRWQIPVYASPSAARQLSYRIAGMEPLLRHVRCGPPFPIGDFTVTAFPTSHDGHGGVDYRFDCGSASVGAITDTGYVTEEARHTLSGVELLVLESNHDVEWLRSGPYPYQLKARILSDHGHLSNDTAAEFAAEMVRCGTRQIVLAHLSKENNTPQRALDAVCQALSGTDASVEVAPRGELSRAYVAEGKLCRR